MHILSPISVLFLISLFGYLWLLEVGHAEQQKNIGEESLAMKNAIDSEDSNDSVGVLRPSTISEGHDAFVNDTNLMQRRKRETKRHPTTQRTSTRQPPKPVTVQSTRHHHGPTMKPPTTVTPPSQRRPHPITPSSFPRHHHTSTSEISTISKGKHSPSVTAKPSAFIEPGFSFCPAGEFPDHGGDCRPAFRRRRSLADGPMAAEAEIYRRVKRVFPARKMEKNSQDSAFCPEGYFIDHNGGCRLRPKE